MMATKKRLIVIEGLDGSGKATQTALLPDKLGALGIHCRTVTFPCYDQPSSAPVKMYLDGSFGSDPDAVNPYAAASFYAVDRFASFVRDWKAQYEAGQVIIADRYATSNAIYQMNKLPSCEWTEYLRWLRDFEYEKLNIPQPDLVIYLDMPVDVSQTLMDKRYEGDPAKKDIHERNVVFLNRCRESALFAAQNEGWTVIPCTTEGHVRTVEEMGAAIWTVVRKILD